MRKIKIIGAGRLKYCYKEFFKRLNDKFGDDAIQIKLEIPASNNELCTEIRESIDYLEKLIEVAKNRNICVVLNHGVLKTPINIKNSEVEIFEVKQY